MLDITNAYALSAAPQQAASNGTQPQPNPIVGMFPIFVIFFIFYFLLIKPQKKKQLEHQKMLENLGKNEEVVTTGGMHGGRSVQMPALRARGSRETLLAPRPGGWRSLPRSMRRPTSPRLLAWPLLRRATVGGDRRLGPRRRSGLPAWGGGRRKRRIGSLPPVRGGDP